MRFQATVELANRTATGVEVPVEIVAGLGGSKRPAVRATINGYTYRSSVASMGGRFMLSISAEVRGHAHVAAGDVVDVDLELDTEPREVLVPDDFSGALSENEAAAIAFEAMSYSNKRRIVLSIDDAKTAETRKRRIDKAILALAEGTA